MNWDRIAGATRLHWGRLTGDYASVVAGLRQRSLGRIRADYVVTRLAQKKQLSDWLEQQHKVDPIHK